MHGVGYLTEYWKNCEDTKSGQETSEGALMEDSQVS